MIRIYMKAKLVIFSRFQPGKSDSYDVAVKPESKKKGKKAELDDLKKEIEFVSKCFAEV